MAWTGVENFDSYGNNEALNGKTGGSGWASGWSTANDFRTTTTSPMQGTTMAYRTNPSGGGSAVRIISSPAAKGIIYMRGKSTSGTSTVGWQMFFQSPTPTFMGIIRQGNGKIRLFNNVTLTDIENASFSANVAFELYCEYDCDTDKYRARLGSAPSSTWYTFFGGGTSATIDRVAIANADTFTGTLNFDDIKSGEAPAPAPSGPTRASIINKFRRHR